MKNRSQTAIDILTRIDALESQAQKKLVEDIKKELLSSLSPKTRQSYLILQRSLK